MAKNFVTDGKSMQWANNTEKDVLSGDIAVVEDTVGVAVVDILVGETGTVALEGVWELPAVNSAIAQGKTLYVGDSGKLTATKGANSKYAGVCFYPKDAGGTTVTVKLG